MFFSVSTNKDSRFPNQHSTDIGYFNCDNGWTEKLVNGHTVFFKGYVEGNVDLILPSLVNDPVPQYQGNFCAVIFNQSGCTITHDIHRGFPMYYYDPEKIATNLLLIQPEQATVITSDTYVALDHNLFLKDQYFDPIGSIDSTELTMEQCVSAMQQLLADKLNLVDFTDYPPIKMFLTGGIDTATVAALLSSQSANYDHINYEHLEYDYFIYKNIEKIREHHWGYRSQLHHWETPTVLASGGCGDEFLMRGPTTAALWAAWHGIDIVDLLSRPGNNDYHRVYFLKPNNKQVFVTALQNRKQLLELYPTYSDLVRQILNINVNDYQHWHLGNTLTFTPFKDLTLTKLLLQTSTDVILSQILDAQVSRELIQSLDPQWLKYVSKDKAHYHWTQLADLIV